MVLWGIVCVCQGLVTNFSGLAAARWFLGLFEAGLFPGVKTLSSSESLMLMNQVAISTFHAGTKDQN